MPQSLKIALVNRTTSNTVYAYITGQAIQNGGQRVLLQSDGHSLYFPASPSAIGSPLTQDCAIPLGAPGNTVNVTIPQIAGGRIWFSVSEKLTFLVNPGPALVEPSVTNPTDPNININWSFCEFTLNNDQLYANISYVDFVSNLPIGLKLTNTSGGVQTVSGMPTNGLNKVVSDLRAQAALDKQPWDKLIVNGPNGQALRALSPNHGQVVNASYFSTYYKPYVASVYAQYSKPGATVSINTQAAFGILKANAINDSLVFGPNQGFSPPSTTDVFSCSTGPFQTGSDAERNAIIPRLSAAYNRSTLLAETQHPGSPSLYYRATITNHYSRIVHEANADGKGYAFPYDDVTPDGGEDMSGKVNDGNPQLWTVSVGGGGVSQALWQAPWKTQRPHDDLR